MDKTSSMMTFDAEGDRRFRAETEARISAALEAARATFGRRGLGALVTELLEQHRQRTEHE